MNQADLERDIKIDILQRKISVIQKEFNELIKKNIYLDKQLLKAAYTIQGYQRILWHRSMNIDSKSL
tara:strand:- start:9682 stop:9882 length:201 start_codon:yes stop_codon:yes gene_type:complete